MASQLRAIGEHTTFSSLKEGRFSTFGFFIKQLSLGPWYAGQNVFENGLEIAKIFE
jgi:hypothetical protein